MKLAFFFLDEIPNADVLLEKVTEDLEERVTIPLSFRTLKKVFRTPLIFGIDFSRTIYINFFLYIFTTSLFLYLKLKMDQFLEYVDKHQNDFVERLRKAVAIPR